MRTSTIEWVKVMGPIVISWPTVALLFVVLFRKPLLTLIRRFTESEESEAEVGPVKIKLGPIAALPPQHRAEARRRASEPIDLSRDIGSIGDTDAEGTIVGFSVAHGMQSALKAKTGEKVALSPRGIYVTAKGFDEWPGEDYEGTSVLGALRGLKEVGAYLESDWPYSSTTGPKPGTRPVFRISGYTQLAGIEEMLTAMRGGKVVIAMIEATDDFDEPEEDGRVIVRLPLTKAGVTTVCLVGYNPETAEFRFANDWGTNWGLGGFAMIRDTDLAKIMAGAYTLEV